MGEFTTSDGLRLHFSDEGDGPAVLCLAGLTRNGADFDLLAPHLSGHRMIRLDYRGRGLSERDPNPENYNVMREGQDAIELLDHLGVARTAIIGTSRGGMIAMLLAAGHRDRVAGVVLNDVGPVLGAAGIARIMGYVGKTPDWATIAEAAKGLKAAAEAQFPGVPDTVWQAQARAQYQEGPDGLTLRYDPALLTALIAQAAEGPPPDLWPLFTALQGLPVGVIRGANSDILEPATVVEMQARHPGLLIAEVPDRGHAPLLDEPQSLELIHAVLAQSA